MNFSEAGSVTLFFYFDDEKNEIFKSRGVNLFFLLIFRGCGRKALFLLILRCWGRYAPLSYLLFGVCAVSVLTIQIYLLFAPDRFSIAKPAGMQYWLVFSYLKSLVLDLEE